MALATLTINSKNYGAWSLRGWLLCKMSGIDFEEHVLTHDDPDSRDELLLLSSSFLVPRLVHDSVTVWDTMAIGEYLNEVRPDAGLLPSDRVARAHCRAVCGEIHSGFVNLRSALPMNLKAHHPNFKVWAGAQADVDRIVAVWHQCFDAYDSPYLFGDAPTMADAMYAPVCTRFRTYDVELDDRSRAYCDRIMVLPAMAEWIAAAQSEPDELEELDIEF
jgi:glutathione S-transferase